MSCQTSTAPIDINISNIAGKCDLKCDYSFMYQNSACIATNRGDYISLSYDSSSSPPVLYNSSGYNVQEIRIYTPSLHSYAGTKTDAEMIIIHSANTGAKPLLVCVPIKKNNSSTAAAIMLKTIIDTIATNAPSDGESTNVNLPKYNLNSFVPKKPFFSYSATDPYQPCSGDNDYIVFIPLNSSIDITDDSFSKMQSIISQNVYDIKQGPSLFYNEKGPGSGAGSDQIYIDCQPVGQSDEQQTTITDTGTSTTFDINKIMDSPIFQAILGSLIFFILLFILYLILGTIKVPKGNSSFFSGGSTGT
jgi:carbonic anhydrase